MFWVVVCGEAWAGPWYVNKGNTSGIEDGTSWATAFSTIEPACQAAYAEAWPNGPSEVWIAEGIYDEERSGSGGIHLGSGVTILGGFRGDETRVEQRDWIRHVTVLDGSKAYNGLPASHVVYARLDGSGVMAIDGVTIRGGQAESEGGGIYGRNASITVRHCVFEGNRAQGSGGGAYCFGDNVAFEDCVFRNNTAGDYAGGLSLRGNGLRVENCRFEANAAASIGGLFFSALSPGLVKGCAFVANTAQGTSSSSASGGAMGAYGSDIVGCTFTGNRCTGAEAFGGALSGGFLRVVNCVFTANSAAKGGALDGWGAPPPDAWLPHPPYMALEISHCSFAGNRAEIGGVLYYEQVYVTLRNCAAWDNGAVPFSGRQSHERLAHCLLEGGAPEDGFEPERSRVEAVDDLDPQFLDPAQGDLRLGPSSPGRDAATVEGMPAEDLLGRPRPQGAGPDIGAHEMAPVDISGEGWLDALDVQAVINAALGRGLPAGWRADVTEDGRIDALDIQWTVNAVLGR